MVTKTHRQFIIWFTVIFIVTFSGLYTLGLIPSEFANPNQPSILDSIPTIPVIPENLPLIESPTTAAEPKPTFVGETPTHISIAKIGVSAKIVVPSSTSIPALDSALTKGAVYYPGSGKLADGNVFLFGHSTNWSVVQNQAYKTFNGLEKLKAGDEIKVRGTSHIYTYKVVSVSLADSDKVWVDLSNRAKTLTLSTCNTFGQKQQRYVVKAEYLTSVAI